MKTLFPVSSLRMATAAAGLAILAISPAWAEKYASIVVDMDTNKVLHARDADEPRYPASLTKVMTLYLTFDALDSGKLKLTDKLPVSKFAQRQLPSKLGLKAGQTISVQDAIRALVTKSANDVAVVLAEKLGGTEAKFAVKMNAKAKQLGLDHTTFKNASGLPNKAQLTTAADLEKLGEAMFHDHRDRYNYFSTPDFKWKRRVYANHNGLLGHVDGVDGIKTGFTNASGYNLMASAQRNGHRVMAVMLGGTTGRSRDEHVADLLEAAFLAVGGGSPIYAEAPSLSSPATMKSGLGPRPKNPADALAWDQLQKFAAIDAAEVSTSADPAGARKSDDSTEEEGDSSEDAADDGDDKDDATPASTKPATPAHAVVAVTAPAAATPSAVAPAAPPAVALVTEPAPVAVAQPAAEPVAAPVVDSPLLSTAAGN